ncbi:MAG: GNAT family N-acetyltransferase [bacterium]|nr:GNAT family N-acetyltransferase [bacterium]
MTALSVGVEVHPPTLRRGRVTLRPLAELDTRAWRRLHAHFRDPEIAHLNGTLPSRMPLWLLRRVLRSDASRPDRRTFGIHDADGDYIGTVELYDLRGSEATLGIIIGERTHWSRGFGSEAMRALLAYAFEELGLERVRLHTFGDNVRAQSAYRKVGFVEQRRETNAKGRVDVHMALLRSAWFSHRGAPRDRVVGDVADG